MSIRPVHIFLNFTIAAVWFTNGLWCKVLNMVPRHQQIVAHILGSSYADTITRLIGVSELLMALWIISRIRPRWCALTQMLIVAAMNVLEFFLAPDLLLWGHFNALFAFLFILLIYCNEYLIGSRAAQD